MPDYDDYTTGDDGYQGNGNGYHHLQGDWALFYKVASGFLKRVKPEDRQDFLHDLLLAMARVKAKYEASGKPLTEAGLIRVACYEVADYWRKWFKRLNGTDCGRCSKAQRKKCRSEDLYGECPKAVKLDSLDRLIEDGEGNKIELYQMIADDNAVDIVARLEARHILQGYPHRFVRIAFKKYCGLPLDKTEARYYQRHRRRVVREYERTLL
jgi:hypothetical protein